MKTLSAERCVACRRDSPRVTEAEIGDLGREVPDWQLLEREGIPRLERIFHFPNFADALAFTDRVGALAEEEGHHPALLTEWGRVTVSWWTHKIRGLHRNDFIMAAKTDALAAASASSREETSDELACVTEERPGCPGARRALGGLGGRPEPPGQREISRAPRLRRGVPSDGGFGGRPEPPI